MAKRTLRDIWAQTPKLKAMWQDNPTRMDMCAKAIERLMEKGRAPTAAEIDAEVARIVSIRRRIKGMVLDNLDLIKKGAGR